MTTIRQSKLQTKIAKAIDRAIDLWPRETYRIDTMWVKRNDSIFPAPMAVDLEQNWLIYSKAADEYSIEDCSIIILHECMHLEGLHGKRFEALLGASLESLKASREMQRKFRECNVWADCAINSRLVAEGHTLPAGGCLPEAFGFPPGLAFEDYYRLAQEKREKQQEQPEPPKQPQPADDGEPGDGDGDSGEQGTGDVSKPEPESKPGAADKPEPESKPGAADKPEPCESATGDCGPVLSAEEFEMMLTTAIIEAIERERVWERASDIARDAKANTATLEKALQKIIGRQADERSYSRPSRRTVDFRQPKPSVIHPEPKLGIVLDTSGSMNGESNSLAVAAMLDILKRCCAKGATASVAMGGDRLIKLVDVKPGDRFDCTPCTEGANDLIHVAQELCRARHDLDCIVFVTDGVDPWKNGYGEHGNHGWKRDGWLPKVPCIVALTHHWDKRVRDVDENCGYGFPIPKHFIQVPLY